MVVKIICKQIILGILTGIILFVPLGLIKYLYNDYYELSSDLYREAYYLYKMNILEDIEWTNLSHKVLTDKSTELYVKGNINTLHIENMGPEYQRIDKSHSIFRKHVEDHLFTIRIMDHTVEISIAD